MPSLIKDWQLALSIFLVVIVAELGAINFLLGPQISFALFYFLPIMLAAWYLGAPAGIFISILSAGVWYVADTHSGYVYSSPYIPLWNGLIRFMIFVVITLMIQITQKNIRLSMESRLFAERRASAVESAQKIIVALAANITQYNSEVLVWIARQRRLGRSPPPVVENACRNIAANMQALTKVYFAQSPESTAFNPDELVRKLTEEIENHTKSLFDQEAQIEG